MLGAPGSQCPGVSSRRSNSVPMGRTGGSERAACHRSGAVLTWAGSGDSHATCPPAPRLPKVLGDHPHGTNPQVTASRIR